MAQVPGLMKRDGTWTVRIRVPDRLRGEIKKREIWKSLGAVSHAEAARLARIERHNADQLFIEAERALRTAPAETLSDAQLHHLARAFFFGLEEKAVRVPLNELGRQALAEANRDDLFGVSQSPFDSAIQGIVTEFAEWAKVKIKPGSEAFFAMCRVIQRALIEHYHREDDRLSHRQAKHRDPLFADVDKTHPPKPSLTLADAVKRYKEDPVRANVAPKTRAAWSFRFGAWLDLLGEDTPVADVTRDHIRKALDILLVVPQNAAKHFPGMALRDVARRTTKSDLPRLSSKSIQLYIDALNSIFKFLVDEQILPRNPVLGLKGPRDDDEEEARRPWTADELNGFFRAPPYDKPWREAPLSWVYWLPLIALFSGAREAELIGLMRSDLVEIDGLHFLQIQKNELRRLKTKQSKRLLPIHPTLIEIGLLTFIEAAPADGRVFRDLPQTKLGPVHAVSKSLGRRIRQFIPDTRVVFHSFRHNFRDAMREANVPEEIVGALGGWTKDRKSAMSSYGRGHSEKTLAAWMAKVRYEGFSFGHLIPTRQPPASS